jgi:hypothetical protein
MRWSDASQTKGGFGGKGLGTNAKQRSLTEEMGVFVPLGPRSIIKVNGFSFNNGSLN